MATSSTGTISLISQPQSSGGSARTPICRRPKLMRSSVTAPCLATSNASRNDMVSQSRASTLLSKVASYSLNRQDCELRAQPACDQYKSTSSQENSLLPHDHHPGKPLGVSKDNIYADPLLHVSAGPCYFSFPSIEDFLDHENNSEVLEKGMDSSSGRETP